MHAIKYATKTRVVVQSMGEFSRPTRLDDALQSLEKGSWRILAGGTDFYPAQGDQPISESLLDLTAVPELRGISKENTGWRLGGLTTWTDVIEAPLPAAFDGLKAAAREVGSIQIQNSGTLAGNICNASPAADGVPPLLTLNAEIELASPGGKRRVALADFITGVRQTLCRPDELVSALYIPAVAPESRSSFLKLGARRYLVISIAMVAVVITPDEHGKVVDARIAVGSCSPVAKRLTSLEGRLTGQTMAPGLSKEVMAEDVADLTPINDVRGTADYRIDVAEELVRRALEQAVTTIGEVP